MPYVATTRTPASSARPRRAGSRRAPPTSTVSKPRSRSTSAASSSIRASWVGTSGQVPPLAGQRVGRAPRPASVPARTERNSTWSPATYAGGRFSSHWPGPPSRACVASAEARIAARESSTRFGAPGRPGGLDGQRRRVVGGVPVAQQREDLAGGAVHGSQAGRRAAHEGPRYACRESTTVTTPAQWLEGARPRTLPAAVSPSWPAPASRRTSTRRCGGRPRSPWWWRWPCRSA